MTKRSQRPIQDASRLWLWGTHACHAALENPSRHCFRLLMTESARRELSSSQDTLPCKIEVLDSASLSRLLPPGAVHQGIAMEVAPLPEKSLSELSAGVLVVLDQVTDPHNVGAILRTARALGALGVVMTERNAPSLGGVLAKTASGALDLLPVWKVTNLARTLEELKEEGFWIIGLDEGSSKTLSQTDLPPKLALVLGAEGEGLRRLTREKCDFFGKLPTDPVFSTLNVSVAAALALYELIKKE